MNETEVKVDGARVSVSNWSFESPAVAGYLNKVDPPARMDALAKALDVGVYCLERASASQDLEFVRHQVERLLGDVEGRIRLIPAEAQKAMVEKIGDKNGQVLSPVRELVESAQREVTSKVADVRRLLDAELDPSKQTTTLGKALASLRDLLDAHRTDSIQGRLAEAVKSVAGADGELARAVKANVAEGIKPLADELNRLAKQIHGDEMAQEIVGQTTLKGRPFEELVLERVKHWAGPHGLNVTHVGSDNQPGDIVVRIEPDSAIGTSHPITLIIEAKDRETNPVGRKKLTEKMTEIMNHREASHGVWVCSSVEGFTQEIGEWGEGSSEGRPWVACTIDLLLVALRFLVVQERLRALKQEQRAVDTTSILAQVTAIETSLRRIGGITRKVSDITGAAQGIREESDVLRQEIKASLTMIEDALKNQVQAAASPAA